MTVDQSPEPLLPELAARVAIRCHRRLVHHPLLVADYPDASHASYLNASYRDKLRLTEQAFRDGDWSEYVFNHKRPYRLQALLRVMRPDRLHGAEFWRLVAELWVDSESIHQEASYWRAIWSLPEPDRHAVMSDDDRAARRTFWLTFSIVRVHDRLAPGHRVQAGRTIDMLD